MYTLQRDSHGNYIVCKGDRLRAGYMLSYTGAYDECMKRKFAYASNAQHAAQG